MENKILSGLRFSSLLSSIYSFIDTDARYNINEISGKLEYKANKYDIKDSTIIINQNGIKKGSFTLNQISGETINLLYPTKLSELSGDLNHKTVSEKEKDLWSNKANSSDLTSHTENNVIHITSDLRDNWNGKANISDIKNATITLKQDGVTKGSFTLNQKNNATINFDAGSGTIGSVSWGSIKGTLSNQTDLNTALNNKALSSDIKNSTITLKQGGVIKGTFTLNQASNGTINLDANTTIANLTTISNGDTMQPDGHYEITMTGNTTLNAGGGTTGKSAGAELFINPGSYTFTAGTNLTLVNELTPNKINYCTLCWNGTACRMYVILGY